METTGIKTLVCGIAKLENDYIREWVEHYKKLGFTNVVIYDNNDLDGERFEDVIGDYIENGYVIIEDARGKTCYQHPAYIDCYKKYNADYDWIAFYDIDEFLELKKAKTIDEYLSQEKFNDFDVIYVNWKIYTDDNKVRYSSKPVQERFTRPMPYKKEIKYPFPENNHHKSLVRGHGTFESLEFKMRYGSHTPCNATKCCNSVGKEVPMEFWTPYVYDEAILKHYQTKTIEEWVNKKQVRRYPDSPPNINIHHPHLSLQFFFIINEKTKEKEKYLKSLAR
jgi:hypothetical protein